GTIIDKGKKREVIFVYRVPSSAEDEFTNNGRPFSDNLYIVSTNAFLERSISLKKSWQNQSELYDSQKPEELGYSEKPSELPAPPPPPPPPSSQQVPEEKHAKGQKEENSTEDLAPRNKKSVTYKDIKDQLTDAKTHLNNIKIGESSILDLAR